MAEENDPEKIVHKFFQHDKEEAPQVDPNFGSKESNDSGTRQEEHKLQRREEVGLAAHPLVQGADRARKNAIMQADEYGREMSISATKPQTRLEN